MLTLRNLLFIRLMLCTSIMSLDQIYGIRSLKPKCSSRYMRHAVVQQRKGLLFKGRRERGKVYNAAVSLQKDEG